MLARHERRYDPQIAKRLLTGAAIDAGTYIDLLRARDAYIAAVDVETDGYDALLWPTVAIVPPAIAALEADSDMYGRVNALVLRNTSAVNAFDGCALSLPMAAADGAPAGLMIAGRRGSDARVLRIGAALETLLAR